VLLFIIQLLLGLRKPFNGNTVIVSDSHLVPIF